MSGITGGANGLIGIPPMSVFGYALSSKLSFYPFALVACRIRFCSRGCFIGRRLPYASAIANPELNGVEWRRHAPLPDHRIRDRQRYCRHRGRAEHALFPVSPRPELHFSESVSYLTMLVVGGRAGVLGPVIGVLVLTPLPELLRSAQGLQHVVYGANLVVSLLFVPDGLASLREF